MNEFTKFFILLSKVIAILYEGIPDGAQSMLSIYIVLYLMLRSIDLLRIKTYYKTRNLCMLSRLDVTEKVSFFASLYLLNYKIYCVAVFVIYPSTKFYMHNYSGSFVVAI